MTNYWLEARDAGLRQAAFAESQLPPGTIGAVPTALTLDHQDIGESQALVGDVGPFDVVDCLRRQIDSRNVQEEAVREALVAHVDAGRITDDEANLALRGYHFPPLIVPKRSNVVSLGRLTAPTVRAYVQDQIQRPGPQTSPNFYH